MSGLRQSIFEVTIKDLDRELIARGAEMPEEERFKFEDEEGTPERDDVMCEVRKLYNSTSLPPRNEALRDISDGDLVNMLIMKTEDSSPDRGIYDQDDRSDYFEIPDSRISSNADSVAVIFKNDKGMRTVDDSMELDTKHFGDTFRLCTGEPFHHQPIARKRIGTAFLVKEDVVATAAHCLPRGDVSDLRIVFGYKMLDNRTPATRIPKKHVYRGKRIIESVHNRLGDGADWALVRLDRKVEGRKILPLSGMHPAGGQEVYVIGHPLGLPQKFAPGGTVCDYAREKYFTADLDIYSGNSGSPVFDTQTHEVLGIVVRGENNDFRWTGKCYRSFVFLSARAYGGGAHCTRVSQFIDRVKEL